MLMKSNLKDRHQDRWTATPDILGDVTIGIRFIMLKRESKMNQSHKWVAARYISMKMSLNAIRCPKHSASRRLYIFTWILFCMGVKL